MTLRRMFPYTSRVRGVTLIELMVVVAIMAILLMVAVPSFVQFQRNSALTSAANGLVGAVANARGEAMKRALPVMIMPTSGNSFANGWIVFVDVNRDGTYAASVDILVSQQAALPSYLSASVGGSSYFLFDASGFSRSTAAAFQSNNLTMARTDVGASQVSAETRRVVVAMTGRARVCKPSSDPTCTASATE